MFVARVQPRLRAHFGPAKYTVEEGAIRATVERGELILQLQDPMRAALTLDDLQRTLAFVQNWPGSKAGRMKWHFSNVSLDCDDLPRLVSRWEETGEPPVLDIIGLITGGAEENGTHHSRGLYAFVGHEVAAQYRRPEQCEEAARALARLARHILMHGAVPKTTVTVVLGGRNHSLAHSETPDERNVIVTIML